MTDSPLLEFANPPRLTQVGTASRDSSAAPSLAIDIAVIVVTFKTASLTIESLRSLAIERAMSGLQIRAIVVDNASGDLPAIAQAATRFGWTSWVTLVHAPKNGGFAYGNNLGIGQAFSSAPPTYVYLLNPDAQVRPGAIAALVEFLETHREVGIAGSRLENIDGSENSIAFRFPGMISEIDHGLEFGLITRLLKPWVTVMTMNKKEERVDWICGASMMIRPEVLQKIGGLDENYFLYFEETDFCLRARKAGFPTWYVPSSQVMHIGGQSTAGTDLNNEPKRLPPCWFESRRRYFVLSLGVPRAMVLDVVAVVAHSLGYLKRIVQGRRHKAVPYYLRDLIRYSVLWPRNREIPPPKSTISGVQPHPVGGSS